MNSKTSLPKTNTKTPMPKVKKAKKEENYHWSKNGMIYLRPKAYIVISYERVPMDNDYDLLRVIGSLNNIGDIPIKCSEMICSLTEVVNTNIYHEDKMSLDFPDFGEDCLPIIYNDVFIEPCEVEEFYFDFTVPKEETNLFAYVYIQNDYITKECGNPVGWQKEILIRKKS